LPAAPQEDVKEAKKDYASHKEYKEYEPEYEKEEEKEYAARKLML
jgi:hypothetical protein